MKLLKPKPKKRTHGEEIFYRRENLSLKHELKYYHTSYFTKALPKRMKYKDASNYYTQKINHAMGWDDTTLKVLCTNHIRQANNNCFEPSVA